MMRWISHLLTTPLSMRRRFPAATLDAIDAAVKASEATHSAEIRVALETSLSLRDLRRGITPRERAVELFSRLRVWDTERNNGVLLYLLLAEHDIEIVADRGFTGRVAPAEWQSVCTELELALRAGRYREGCIAAVQAIGALAARHFPPDGADRNELPDRPWVR